MLRLACRAAMLLLAACVPTVDGGPDKPYRPGPKPAYPVLGSALPAGTTAYSNASLADAFVELTHGLEWGGNRPNLVRYENPVVIAVDGDGGQPYLEFLDRFLAQLRSRTGIAIRRGTDAPNLLVHFINGRDFQQRVPQHFCVVAHGLIPWERFRQSPSRYGTRGFEEARRIRGMSIFIPDNATPHVVRTCLIEEITQALGPANDLYGLGPSIFNDDAAHLWPTKLDYLFLRTLYSPELKTGMSRSETRAAARIALDRLNPQGIGAPSLPAFSDARVRDWPLQIRTAFDRTKSRSARIAAAKRAVAIAEERAPDSAFHCRALSALARVGRERAAEILPIVRLGDGVCARAHGPDDIRVARIQLEIARLHYDLGNPAVALALTEDADTVFAAYGQDERLTALYALRSAALRAIQQGTRSFEVRRLGAEWGAYALGADHPNVRRWKVD